MVESTRPHPTGFYRWAVLVIISVAMAGNYYIYDSINALERIFIDRLGFSATQFGWLNASYSVAAVATLLIGGIVIDRIGTKKAILAFSVIFSVAGEPSWQRPLFIAVGAGVLAMLCSTIYWAMESYAERQYELGQAGQTDKLEFKGIFRFEMSYWLVVGLCFTFYSAIFPFRTFAIDFFTNKILAAHGGTAATEAARVLSLECAGSLNSLLPLTAMIATPLFGLLVDRVGKRAWFMMLGSLLLMPVYLMMAYSSVSLYIPVSMMGIVFSLIPAVMWPSVAYIVDQSRLGTAYALMTLIQQIGFFHLNLLIGKANDYSHAGLENPGGYALGMWIFSILGFIGMALSILLRARETGPHGHGLETITTSHSAA
jgi:MFS family permease